MDSKEIRQSFLDFFRLKGHRIVDSCSLLPEAPNLLFTNAGMNPFVPYFLGQRTPQSKRVANTQKCIRAGGKHNDLEDVGFDTYHHTFFEMLGNWSFGDYFKKESIEWAWELLTKVWKFPKERLYATVYKPEANDPAEFDHEAYQIWKSIFEGEGLNPDIHILAGNKKDNFWMMGDTGPCGPCTEIHMDLTPKGDTNGRLVNQGSPQCIEIWNLVFIQYNALPGNQFEPLKEKFVDTGMGLERVAGIFASTRNFKDFSQPFSNYESDLFKIIFESLEKISGHVYQGRVPMSRMKVSDEMLKDCAFRIIADHLRTLTFAIADGILPGNEGRNYVLRRILRRALLFGHKLSLPNHFFSSLAAVVIEKMGFFFKELKSQSEVIQKVLILEENAFAATLKRGLAIFEKWTEESLTEVSGEKAFLLYDTYGFPLDLTQLVAAEKGLTVNTQEFEQHMELQRLRAKSAQKKEQIQVASEQTATEFVGYDEQRLANYKTVIEDVFNKDNKTYLIVKTTPFYAEKGGQIGDTGWVSIGNESYEVQNTILNEKTALHVLNKLKELPKKGETVQMTVDVERRNRIQRHHTGTHLLHWALRKILGSHVKQAGSLVTDSYLRFDFSHFEKISDEQIREVERLCNQKILENQKVIVEERDFEDRPSDCLAFFGEKYGDKVRVVTIEECGAELCGGTHLHATGELGLIKICQESSVAAGVRRIEAVVGEAAYDKVNTLWKNAKSLEKLFSCTFDQVLSRCEFLLQQKSTLEKNLKQRSNSTVTTVLDKSIHDLHWSVLEMGENTVDGLRSLGKQHFKQQKADVLLIKGSSEEKDLYLIFCSQEAIDSGYKADAMIRHLQPWSIRGGGKADFATGGGKTNASLKTIADSLVEFQALGKQAVGNS